jgi:lauroyl/myristoyl acyltransferase
MSREHAHVPAADHHEVGGTGNTLTPLTASLPLPHAPLIGKLIYYGLPIRRDVVLANLRRAFGATLSDREIIALAQAHYAHLARVVVEYVRFSFDTPARRATRVRVENIDAILRAHARGRGVLLLASHLGNWEVTAVAGLASFPQYRGRFHVLRRPLWPRWLERLVTWRFRRGGLGVLPKKGSLDTIIERLAAGDAVVFVMDQHAGRDGVRVDFFGHPAGTFRSLALIALTTSAPVIPLATWREPDGQHVLRFEEALPLLESDDPGEAIRANTRAYNVALEQLIKRHPEQWFWVHRRWKE